MKLTEKRILSCIKDEQVMKVGNKTTLVLLILENGFEIIGTSACVNPAEYDHEIGRSLARKRAIDKIWELEGYRAQCSEYAPSESVD